MSHLINIVFLTSKILRETLKQYDDGTSLWEEALKMSVLFGQPIVPFASRFIAPGLNHSRNSVEVCGINEYIHRYANSVPR